MLVANTQGREKPKKIEQKEVQTQVEQTTLLYSLIYIVQVQGEEKKNYIYIYIYIYIHIYTQI